jgi:hypothetical protein
MEWVQYSLDGATLDEKYVNKTQNFLQLNYPCSSSSSCYPYIVTLIPGPYILQLYGAGGGDGGSINSLGGKGGYSTGSIEITSLTTFYVYVGGKGASKSGADGTIAEGGFNGGGYGITGSGQFKTGGGGGATDIRNGSKQLINRIIVAGGGGGGSSYNLTAVNETGGDGGGIEGKTGGIMKSRYPGSGGNQTSHGTNTVWPVCNGNSNVGGIGHSSWSSGGGGGGGYYGGAGGSYAGGGGGSGYVGGVTSKFVERYTNYSTNENNGYVIIRRVLPDRTENVKALISCPIYYPFGFNFPYLIILGLTK